MGLIWITKSISSRWKIKDWKIPALSLNPDAHPGFWSRRSLTPWLRWGKEEGRRLNLSTLPPTYIFCPFWRRKNCCLLQNIWTWVPSLCACHLCSPNLTASKFSFPPFEFCFLSREFLGIYSPSWDNVQVPKLQVVPALSKQTIPSKKLFDLNFWILPMKFNTGKIGTHASWLALINQESGFSMLVLTGTHLYSAPG